MPTLSVRYKENDVTYIITAVLSPYSPGNTYGPPEFCEPPEGGDIEEIELVEVLEDLQNSEDLEKAFRLRLDNDEKLKDVISEKFSEAIVNYDYDYD